MLGQIALNRHQYDFLQLPHKYRALICGYGAGKTWAGCAGFLKHFLEFPNVTAGYFAPSYSQIADIFYPTMSEFLDMAGFTCEVKEAKKEVYIYYNNKLLGVIKCRSMDNPSSIVGFKIGYAVVDEIDTMKLEKAKQVWRKIQARMRFKVEGLKNRIDVTTTPEGYSWAWWQFVDCIDKKPELAKDYGMIQASTYDNAKNLPDDYISSLVASYPEQLIEAYLNGQFTALNSGSVYRRFDRKLNSTTEFMTDSEPVHIGQDFNVTNMTSAVMVIRDGKALFVDEITQAYDTEQVIEIIKERYWKKRPDGGYVRTRPIFVYPDASANSRKSVSGKETDISMLRKAGFTVICDSTNPSVTDRVNNVNGMICNGKQERRLLVNVGKCPTITNCLEKQTWGNNSLPDKTTGFDHGEEAVGYVINQLFKIDFKRTLVSGISA